MSNQMFSDMAKSRRRITLSILAGVLLILQLTNIAVNKVAHKGENTPKSPAKKADTVYLAAESTLSPTDIAPEPEKEEIIIPIVVSAASPIGEDFIPDNLVYIGEDVKGNSSLQINATVLAAYKVMYADIKAAEIAPPMIISAYRSYARQKTLFDNKVKQYGEGQTLTAKPGTSEHQYSGCIDLSTDGTCQNDFGETKVGKWISENSYKYGFVVRYPVDKKDITGISFEPWHIRYVGVKHATAMHEMDMCLEEYVEYLKEKYPDAEIEKSPDQYPTPRWAGDTEGKPQDVPSDSDSSDVSRSDVSSADAQ